MMNEIAVAAVVVMTIGFIALVVLTIIGAYCEYKDAQQHDGVEE
jgi:uncharacterized membrane protein